MIRMFAVLLVFCFAFSIEDSVFAENPYSKVFSEYSGINDIRFKGFVIGTLSTFTSVRNVSVGFNGYLGVHKNNVGLGVLGTYEIGLLGDIWLIKDDRFINIYPTFSYQFGKSTLIFSHGLSFFTTVFRLVDIEDLRRPVTAISYIYQPVGRLTFMFQGRLQDRDLWGEESSFTNRDVVLSIGVGF